MKQKNPKRPFERLVVAVVIVAAAAFAAACTESGGELTTFDDATSDTTTDDTNPSDDTTANTDSTGTSDDTPDQTENPCGDGVCQSDEDEVSCPADCVPTCAQDVDRDGVCDDADNCAQFPNPTQDDRDGDGFGDGCDACPLSQENDVDGDGVCVPADNCPAASNADQRDGDGDGLGDVCDPCPIAGDFDTDGDTFCDTADNCPALSNTDQANGDGDRLGDACDACPEDAQNDEDGDGVCAPADNCPTRYNLNQLDIDSDSLGDACDTCPDQPGGDTDADGACDVEDNCVSDYNPDQMDTNGDGVGDACDPCPTSADSDHDTICNDVDRCPGGDDRVDANSDGMPDACEACQWQTRTRWTVIYHDLMTYGGEGPFSFQVSLYDNGEIAFQYDHMHNIAGPTVGLESPTDNFHLLYMFPTINLPDRTRLEFAPREGGFDTRISTDPNGPVFDWQEHPTGVPHLVLGDDSSAVVTLPFAFPWMDRVYTTVNVSSNGYLWFGAPSQDNCCEWQQERLPTAHNWLGLIAPAWFDLNPIAATGTGHVAAWSDEEQCVIDCTGAAHGSARLDVCGECAGGTTGKRPGFALDCHGDCFGVAYLDACGICIGGNTGLHHSDADQGCGCFEEPARPWYLDSDGDALGAGDPTVACRQEVPPGYVTNDDDLEPDCATNDTAQCGTCGALDCTGLCNGGAAVDPCGICAGGNTGVIPSPPDDLNGDGYPDACSGPDLVVDEPYLRQHLSIDHVFVAPNDCYINEGCVGGPGDRKVLRFGTMIGNIGNADLAIGPPGQDPEYWEFDACHDHYHYEDYAFYQLFTEAGHELSSIGYKNGWCVLDLTEYGSVPAPNGCHTYSCGNQGISAGCADIYSSSLACQWIDVTAVPDGVYKLRVITNPRNHVRELRYDNNAAEVTVRIQGDVVTLVP